jgi:coproporphyrinogen III oxidase-like Fe-S oxidoreductase
MKACAAALTAYSTFMSTVSEAPLPTEKKPHATEAGNYFVSNYPPFSFWKPDQVPALEKVLAQPAPRDIPLGVYFHIPFCRKRCHFCYFKVYTDKNASEIRAYINAGMKEMAQFAARPYLAGRKANFVYFGGGTPSYLSAPQLRELTDRMKDLIPWDEAEEVAFEAEPGTLNEMKLQCIRDIGVTRLSLGVEHFDDHILESNGRAHRSGEVDRAFKFARTLGFEHINIDLIAGMMNDTEQLWKAAVAKAVELGPDAVTIYQMEVPYNTGIYQQMKAEGKVTAPVADWETKRAWVNYCFEEFVKAGYTVTSATTDRNRDDHGAVADTDRGEARAVEGQGIGVGAARALRRVADRVDTLRPAATGCCGHCSSITGKVTGRLTTSTQQITRSAPSCAVSWPPLTYPQAALAIAISRNTSAHWAAEPGAPERSTTARSLVSCVVKLPEIWPEPPMIGSLMLG